MRKRSKYRPRPAPTATPMEIATHRAGKIEPERKRELMAAATQALDRLKRCENSKDAWEELVDVLNLAEALCGLRIANNLLGMVKLGHGALSEQITRYSQGRGWALYGHEISRLEDALWVYSVQLEHCSAGEAVEAISRVKRKVYGAKSGNAGAGVIVHKVDWAAA